MAGFDLSTANEAVRRVDGVILATSQVRLVPRLGQRQFRVVAPVGVLLVAHRYRLESSLDAEWAQEPQHFRWPPPRRSPAG